MASFSHLSPGGSALKGFQALKCNLGLAVDPETLLWPLLPSLCYANIWEAAAWPTDLDASPCQPSRYLPGYPSLQRSHQPRLQGMWASDLCSISFYVSLPKVHPPRASATLAVPHMPSGPLPSCTLYLACLLLAPSPHPPVEMPSSFMHPGHLLHHTGHLAVWAAGVQVQVWLMDQHRAGCSENVSGPYGSDLNWPELGSSLDL